MRGYDETRRRMPSPCQSIRLSRMNSTAPITAPRFSTLRWRGSRYSRVANPTTAVLEKRMAALEGGVAALCVSTGQAALNYALMNVADCGGNIVVTPQLYGTTHTLLSHILPRQGIKTRFAKNDQAQELALLIDDDTRAVFCETVGNPAGNVCDIKAIADVAHARGVPSLSITPSRRRSCCVPSITARTS